MRAWVAEQAEEAMRAGAPDGVVVERYPDDPLGDPHAGEVEFVVPPYKRPAILDEARCRRCA